MKKIIYRLAVYASMPLTDDAENVDLHTLESAESKAQQRAIERSLFNWLKRWDYDADAELLDYEVVEEPETVKP